jgi:sulfoxide reductase heme-binding subunit YedZ
MRAWTFAASTERRGAPRGSAFPSRGVRAALFVACLLPLARLFLLGWHDALGANPVEFVTRSTGTWALVMLCVTLSVTPLRRLSGWNGLVRLRRMLGLFAFFYGCLHLLTYVWFDQWIDAMAILKDVLERPFVTLGFAGWLLMLPLALTSNAAMIRRLGARWAELHRAVYAVAVLGVLHFWWHKAGKNDLAEPMVYAGVVAVLLGWRAWWRWRRARASRGT